MVVSVFVLIIIFLFVKICLIGSEKCENVLQTFLPICLFDTEGKNSFLFKAAQCHISDFYHQQISNPPGMP